MLVLLCFSFVVQDDFTSLLQRNKMEFKAPRGLREIAPVKNRQMNYEKAYRHKKKRFEVRYAVRPFDKLLAEYRKSKKDSTFFMYDPNTFYKESFKATYLNVSDGKDFGYTILDSAELRSNYRADWGATTTVDAGKEFGMGYKYCLIIYLFKKDRGEGYYFFMADDKAVLAKMMAPACRNLVFSK